MRATVGYAREAKRVRSRSRVASFAASEVKPKVGKLAAMVSDRDSLAIWRAGADLGGQQEACRTLFVGSG